MKTVVMEGEFLCTVEENTFTAKAGDSMFGPRTIPHTFAQTNEGGIGRLLMSFQLFCESNNVDTRSQSGLSKFFFGQIM